MEEVTVSAWMFDLLLASTLLWLAWRALTSPELFKAVVLFIAFSLLMALTWVRLGAPDIALAEAAIGAGLTGVLLLAALASLRSYESGSKPTGQAEKAGGDGYPSWLPAVIMLPAAAGLGYVVFSQRADAPGLSAEVAANMQASGVSNPVTAVLLNFRGYDTLLEMLVLLVALLGVWSLRSEAYHPKANPGPVLDTLSRFLVPVMILVAAYLLWAGAHAPGGAFQAGSVLGAAGVVLLLAGWHLRASLTSLPLRFALVAGPAAFLVLALLTLLIEGQLLEYPPALAGTLILFLETIAALSIGATLAALSMGGRPGNDKKRS